MCFYFNSLFESASLYAHCLPGRLQALFLVSFFLLVFFSKLFSFFLHTVPTPPTFFTKVVNSSSVQVLWELPSKAGKAEGFRLFYRRVPHALFQGPIQLPCHVNAHTIADLGKCMCRECPVLFFPVCQVVYGWPPWL